MSILIFIPCYNCEKQISRVLYKLSKNCLIKTSKVIVVDNLSRDQTAKIARDTADKLGLDCEVLINRLNVGLGGSHKVAFDYAIKNEFSHVLVLHGDDQADIEDVAKLMNQKHLDAVLGARFMRGSSLKGYSKFRIFGNLIFNLIFSCVSRRLIFDLGSGLNLYSIRFIKSRFYTKYPNDLTFNCALLLGSLTKNFEMTFVPITWSEDDQISNAKLFSQSLNILKMVFKFFLFGEQALNSELFLIDSSNYKSLQNGN